MKKLIAAAFVLLALVGCEAQAQTPPSREDLGSGLIDQSQNITVAAMQMADMNVWAHRS